MNVGSRVLPAVDPVPVPSAPLPVVPRLNPRPARARHAVQLYVPREVPAPLPGLTRHSVCNDLSVLQLKTELGCRNKDISGNKSLLIERLLETLGFV